MDKTRFRMFKYFEVQIIRSTPLARSRNTDNNATMRSAIKIGQPEIESICGEKQQNTICTARAYKPPRAILRPQYMILRRIDTPSLERWGSTLIFTQRYSARNTKYQNRVISHPPPIWLLFKKFTPRQKAKTECGRSSSQTLNKSGCVRLMMPMISKMCIRDRGGPLCFFQKENGGFPLYPGGALRKQRNRRTGADFC